MRRPNRFSSSGDEPDDAAADAQRDESADTGKPEGPATEEAHGPVTDEAHGAATERAGAADTGQAEAPPREQRSPSRTDRFLLRWRAPRWKWPKRIALALVLVTVLPVAAGAIALRVNYAGDTADSARTRGNDAYWLGHAWVDGRKNEADVRDLARRLRGTGIRDLYVHTGPMEHDGSLPRSRYPRGSWFVDAVHREMPGVRVQSFLGDKLATETPDGMHLEKARTRAAVLATTRQVLDDGFDGIHLDLEPMHSGDGHYLDLLDDVGRMTRSRNVPLSVAAHQIDPLPGAHHVLKALANHPKYWSQSYFAEVARRVDQIAVMSYDTGMQTESLYGGYVAQQTTLALEVTPPGTDLLMGLPFYYDDTFGHRGSAETVRAAVRGVRIGLTETDLDRENFGVALYVDFAETEENWRHYREGWIGG